MSTSGKLDELTRQRRTDRKNLRRFMKQKMNSNSDVGVICAAAYIKLEELRLDPKRSGLQKHAIVTRLQQEVDQNLGETLREKA